MLITQEKLMFQIFLCVETDVVWDKSNKLISKVFYGENQSE